MGMVVGITWTFIVRWRKYDLSKSLQRDGDEKLSLLLFILKKNRGLVIVSI
jgi:hypothetical protein